MSGFPEYPAIAGHQLRHAPTSFGDMVAVGDGLLVFDTLAEAIDYAADNALTFAILISEYQTFNLVNGLKLGAADKHVDDPALSPAQRLWLAEFVRRWKSIVAHEEIENAIRD